MLYGISSDTNRKTRRSTSRWTIRVELTAVDNVINVLRHAKFRQIAQELMMLRRAGQTVGHCEISSSVIHHEYAHNSHCGHELPTYYITG